MSSQAAPRCSHIKVNGTQCGSPALRNKKFCFYHQENRPWPVECFADDKYATGTITLPYFEDAHSIQSVIRQTVQMVMQKRIECKTASVLLYALQIASSNLKRMELEKPQPEQVVTDVEIESKPAMSIRTRDEVARDNSPEDNQNDRNHEDLPPGTIHACYRPGLSTGSTTKTAAFRVARTLPSTGSGQALSAPPLIATTSSARW